MEKAFCCAPDFPVVQTNYGPVRGYRFREISSFKGIPYCNPCSAFTDILDRIRKLRGEGE